MIVAGVSSIRRKLLELTGRWPTARARLPNDDFHFVLPSGGSQASHQSRELGIVAHIYYVDLLDELKRHFEHMPAPCDLMLTTDSSAKKKIIEVALSDWYAGEVRVRITPNRGRDIAPKLTAFAADYAAYDLLLFVHTKKSETVGWGNDWRRQIFSDLCGSAETVNSIIALFKHEPALGMVAPLNFVKIRDQIAWGDPAMAMKLAARLGADLDFHSVLDFPAGSMFWAKPAALKPLLDLHLSATDFPAEKGQTGDTLAHAIERLFFVSCEIAGYHWCKVSSRTKIGSSPACEFDPDQPLTSQAPLRDIVLRDRMYRMRR